MNNSFQQTYTLTTSKINEKKSRLDKIILFPDSYVNTKLKGIKKEEYSSFLVLLLFLLNCDTFCQVARLVNIQAADGGDMVGQQLQGYDGDDWR